MSGTQLRSLCILFDLLGLSGHLRPVGLGLAALLGTRHPLAHPYISSSVGFFPPGSRWRAGVWFSTQSLGSVPSTL